MKPFNSSCAILFSLLTLFSISNTNAGPCISHDEKKSEIKCLLDDKRFINTDEKELLYKFEA